MTSPIVRPLLLLLLLLCGHRVTCCSFPDALQLDTRDPPWYSHVKTDGSRDAEYYIRHNVMEIHYPRSDRANVRWKCAAMFHDKLLLRREDHLINNYFRCVRFMFRSRSLLQVMWSHEVRTFDLGLCEDVYLKADPWPLVWYGTLKDDYTPCPFNGGFDMNMVDSLLGENGCNLMLRPMRMEAECLGGEGVTFNFMSNNCLPSMKMYVKQQTICVTSWQDSKNHYVVLRRSEHIDLFCLVVPLYRNTNVTAILFSDLACVSDAIQLASIKHLRYFTLNLSTRIFSSSCQDEYDQCSKVTCNAYVKQECQKSCGVCDARSLPQECEFPSDLLGSWLLKDLNGSSLIDISSSRVRISGVGHFQCVSYPNSQPRSSFYTTISLFDNGCRPRFTCLYIRRLGPSVLQYSLSQSFVWPTVDHDLAKAICSDDRFHPDPSPVDDKYRPYEGTGKPIIADTVKPESVNCNLTSVHTISATLPEGYKCSGSLYAHCDNVHTVRLEFPSCGNLIAESTDYRCLANFQGHYWERVLLVQNVRDHNDVICFVFSQYYQHEAYVLVASQCDQKSFSFARSGLRKPMLKLDIYPDGDSCKSIPQTLTTTTTVTELASVWSKLSHSIIEESSNLYVEPNATSIESDFYSPVSIMDTESLSNQGGKAETQKATYVDTRRAAGAKSTSHSDDNWLPADESLSLAGTSSVYLVLTLAVVTISVLQP